MPMLITGSSPSASRWHFCLTAPVHLLVLNPYLVTPVPSEYHPKHRSGDAPLVTMLALSRHFQWIPTRTGYRLGRPSLRQQLKLPEDIPIQLNRDSLPRDAS